MGIPHPPGYPLYVLIGHLFSLLPIGNVAFRINVISSFFAACSAVLLLPIMNIILFSDVHRTHLQDIKSHSFYNNFSRDWTIKNEFRLIGTVPAFMLAFSSTFRMNSIAAEVYTLNTFFAALILLIASLDSKSLSSKKKLYLLSFLLGIGLGNHHTLLLTTPALILLLMRVNISVDRTKLIVMCFQVLFVFILGFSVYLYLPIRSSQQPLLDWANPQTLENFLYSIMRKGYAFGEFSRSLQTFYSQLKTIDLQDEFGTVGLIVGLFGFFKLIRERSLFMAAFFIFFLSFSVLIVLVAGDFDAELENLLPFYLPAYTIFSIFIGLGLLQIYHTWIFLTGRFLPFVIPGMILLVLFSPIRESLSSGINEDFLAIDYGTNKMNSMDENALYFAKTDTDGFSIWYLQMVERYRKDIEMIPVYFLGEKWYATVALKYAGDEIYKSGYNFNNPQKAFVAAITRNHSTTRPIYAGFSDEEFIPAQINLVSHGITYKISPSNMLAGEGPWQYYRLRGLEQVTPNTGFLRKGVLEDYAAAFYNLGLERYEIGMTGKAKESFLSALAITPNDPDTLNNLAGIDADEGIDFDAAEQNVRKAIQLYRNNENIANARDTLAWILYRKGQYAAALEELRAAEDYLEQIPSYYYHRGMAEFRLNLINEAKESLQRALTAAKREERKEIEKTLALLQNRSGNGI